MMGQPIDFRSELMLDLPPILDAILNWTSGENPLIPYWLGTDRFERENGVDPNRYAQIYRRHADGQSDVLQEFHIVQMANSVIAAATDRSDENICRIWRLFAGQDVDNWWNEVAEGIEAADNVSDPDLHELASKLIRSSRIPSLVKIGINLFEFVAPGDEVESLMTLGRSGQFASEVIRIIKIYCEDYVDRYWTLAQALPGGSLEKLELIYDLSEHCKNRPDIQDWLISDGCQFDDDDTIAHTCFLGGRLNKILETSTLDDRLLDGACRIVAYMQFDKFGDADLEIDEDVRGAYVMLLEQLQGRCDSLVRLQPVVRILNSLNWLDGKAEPPGFAEWKIDRLSLMDGIWTRAFREKAYSLIEAILRRRDWRSIVKTELQRGGEEDASIAWECGHAFDIDLWDIGFERLSAQPKQLWLYYKLAWAVDAKRLSRIYEHAAVTFEIEESFKRENQKYYNKYSVMLDHTLSFLLLQMRDSSVRDVNFLWKALQYGPTRIGYNVFEVLETHTELVDDPAIIRAAETRLEAEEDEDLAARLTNFLGIDDRGARQQPLYD